MLQKQGIFIPLTVHNQYNKQLLLKFDGKDRVILPASLQQKARQSGRSPKYAYRQTLLAHGNWCLKNEDNRKAMWILQNNLEGTPIPPEEGAKRFKVQCYNRSKKIVYIKFSLNLEIFTGDVQNG